MVFGKKWDYFIEYKSWPCTHEVGYITKFRLFYHNLFIFFKSTNKNEIENQTKAKRMSCFFFSHKTTIKWTTNSLQISTYLRCVKPSAENISNASIVMRCGYKNVLDQYKIKLYFSRGKDKNNWRTKNSKPGENW